MAKTDTNQSAAPAAADTKMMLDEFCARLSNRNVDGRVELIYGFAYTERKAGRIKDTESNFQARFVAFAKQPVRG